MIDRLHDALPYLEHLPPEAQAASFRPAELERYAEIRRVMRPPHGPGLIGDIDTLIATTALDNGLTLVTTDSDFKRVPDLSIMYISRARLKG